MSGPARYLIPLAFLLFISFVVYSTLNLGQVSCTVCVEFQGDTACRTAAGSTREDAVRVATDNACAQLTSGMTNILKCGQQPPVSVDCD